MSTKQNASTVDANANEDGWAEVLLAILQVSAMVVWGTYCVLRETWMIWRHRRRTYPWEYRDKTLRAWLGRLVHRVVAALKVA